MRNEVLLENRKPIDENLRPLKVGDSCSSLELANRNARIHGDLEVTGSLSVSKLTDLDIDDIIMDDLSCDNINCNTITNINPTIDHTLTFTGSDLDITSSGGVDIDVDG